MYYCTIAPATYLKQLGSRKRHFALAQVALRDDRYRDFYRQAAEHGEHVILDNGAYEGELLGFAALLELAVDIRPSVVVAPDFLRDAEKSRYVAQAFRDYIARGGAKSFDVMEVLQESPENQIAWLGAYKSIAPGTWVGIPKWFTQRARFFTELAAFGLMRTDVQHHFLGINSMDEVALLAKLPIISNVWGCASIDSKCAWKEGRSASYALRDKPPSLSETPDAQGYAMQGFRKAVEQMDVRCRS